MSQAPLREPDVPVIAIPTAEAGAVREDGVSSLLKCPQDFAWLVQRDRLGWRPGLTFLAAAAGLYALYGLAMGVFTGGEALWLATVKAPLVLVASLALCAPSLYVLLCLGGTAVSLRQVLALVSGVACLSGLLLAGLAPVAWLFGVSTDSVQFMVVLHTFAWAVGLACGLRLLGLAVPGGYRRHKVLALWVAIFLVVSAQMLTYFRPVLGTPAAGGFRETAKMFFFEHFFATMVGTRAGDGQRGWPASNACLPGP